MSRKQTTLYSYWSKKERDILYCFPGSAVDGHLLHQTFGCPGLLGTKSSFLDELDRRGYDVTTFKFSVKKKAQD